MSSPPGWHHAFDVMTGISSAWQKPSLGVPAQTNTGWDFGLGLCGFLVIPTVTAAIVAWWYRHIQNLQDAVAAQQKEVQNQQDELRRQQDRLRDQVNLIVAAAKTSRYDVSDDLAAAEARVSAGRERAPKQNQSPPGSPT